MSHPTTELRGTITQATLSQAKVYTLTQAAAAKLRGHSNPGYSVPPNSPAKGDTPLHATVHPYNLAKGDTPTQATLSHQVKVYTLTQAAAVQLRGTL